MTMCCVMVMGSLAGCGKKECDGCGEKKSCKKVEFMGEKADLCRDCRELLNAVYGLDF